MSFYRILLLQKNRNIQRDSMEGVPSVVGWIALLFLGILVFAVAHEYKKQKNKKLK